MRFSTNIPFYASIASYLAYDLQGVLYHPSGSVISQLFLLCFIGMGVYYAFKTLLLSKADGLNWTWGIFMILLVLTFLVSPHMVHGTENEAIGSVSTFGQFKGAFAFSLSFFVAYHAGKNADITDKHLYIIGIIMVVNSYLRFQTNSIELGMEEGGSFGFTNNAAYSIVATMPFMPYIFKKNKILFTLLLISSVFLIIIGAKRGAILCMAASLIFSAIYYIRKSENSSRTTLIILPIAILLCYFAYTAYTSSEYLAYRMERMEEVGIGTRNIAYTTLFNHWCSDQNPITFFFGNGTAQTINIWGNYAHNDWLELLIDNGVFGVFIYMALFIYTLVRLHRSNLGITERLAGYMALIIWFGKSCFSMGYTYFGNAVIIMILGVVLGREQNWRNEETVDPDLALSNEEDF